MLDENLIEPFGFVISDKEKEENKNNGKNKQNKEITSKNKGRRLCV